MTRRLPPHRSAPVDVVELVENFERQYEEIRPHIPPAEHGDCACIHWRLAHAFRDNFMAVKQAQQCLLKNLSQAHAVAWALTTVLQVAAFCNLLLAIWQSRFDFMLASVLCGIAAAMTSSRLESIRERRTRWLLNLYCFLDAHLALASAMAAGKRIDVEAAIFRLAGDRYSSPMPPRAPQSPNHEWPIRV